MTEDWTRFFSLPVSGNAKLLALRLASEPVSETPPAPRNLREFAASLRMMPYEYEAAFLELRDVRVGFMVTPHADRPQLTADCFVRRLVQPEAPRVELKPEPVKPEPFKPSTFRNDRR